MGNNFFGGKYNGKKNKIQKNSTIAQYYFSDHIICDILTNFVLFKTKCTVKEN